MAPTAGGFVRGLLSRAVFLGLLAAALNLAVNPFGVYASQWFEPITLSTRRPKLALYARREPKPDIVILGSSRSLSLDPAYLGELTGTPAFNAAVHGASPEDYLDFARCFDAGRAFPKALIVGLGVEQVLHAMRPVERQDDLADCRPYKGLSAADLLRTYRGLFTAQETWASLRLLGAEWRGRERVPFSFREDGMIQGGRLLPLDQAVDIGLGGAWAPNAFDADALRPESLALLEELLALCRERGARVVVYLPPYHPKALRRYLAESHFAALRGELLGRLQAWSAAYPVTAYDFTDVRSFGGDESMFLDAAHPRHDAERRMLDLMARGLR